MLTRIMYIEYKGDSLTGDARIGRVQFSRTRRSMHYNGRTYQKTKSGYKYNCFDSETGERYWISGCKKDGSDRLYGENLPIYIDEDVREEYWTEIRNRPDLADVKVRNG